MALLCTNKMKTAFAEEAGRIAKLTEREIRTGTTWVFNRIPETKYDTSLGHNPRTLRFAVAPPPEVAYVPMLPAGNEARNFPNPQGGPDIASYADKTGRGCLLPAETLHWGFDEFGRCLRGTALETPPICLMDIQEKHKVVAMIAALRRKMPEYAKEHFNNELLAQVTRFSLNKWVVAEGLPMSYNVPYYPAVPTGGANIGLIRHMENLLRAYGWDSGSKTPMVNGRPALQVYMGRDSLDFAIRQRKRQLGVEVLQNSTTAMDGTFGTTEVYEGIQFIENPSPKRGYLVQDSAGHWEFRQIPRIIVRAGGAEGIMPEVNPDYHKSFVTVGGQNHVVLEEGYIIHPMAMERQAMGPVMTVDGASSPAPFNFEVTMVDAAMIFSDPTCNKDKMFFQMRMRHAYAPLPYGPELMTSFLYIAATPQTIIVNPNLPQPTPATLAPVLPQGFLDPQAANCLPCTTDPTITRDPTSPTCSDLFPANGTGLVQWDTLNYFYDEDATNLTMALERVGGNTGAASVVVTLTEGTATEPENFGIPTGFAGTSGASTTFTKTINWTDGESGVKTFSVPINAAGTDDAGKTFTAVLGTVAGASLTAATTATATIVNG